MELPVLSLGSLSLLWESFRSEFGVEGSSTPLDILLYRHDKTARTRASLRSP